MHGYIKHVYAPSVTQTLFLAKSFTCARAVDK